MTQLISVEPLGDGWAVRTDKQADMIRFESGRAAEKAARQLADKLIEAGQPVEIQIWLRDGTMAGRFVCPLISMGGVARGEAGERDRSGISEHA